MRDLCDHCNTEAERGIHTSHGETIETQLLCISCFNLPRNKLGIKLNNNFEKTLKLFTEPSDK